MNGLPRLVLDTNVLGRAICGSAPSLELVFRWQAGDYTLCVSDDVIREYENALPKVRMGDPIARAAILDQVRRRIHIAYVTPRRRLRISPHEPDNRIIECAIEANAIALITHNEEHFMPWLLGHGIVVSRPREYLPLLPAV